MKKILNNVNCISNSLTAISGLAAAFSVQKDTNSPIAAVFGGRPRRLPAAWRWKFVILSAGISNFLTHLTLTSAPVIGRLSSVQRG